MVFLKTLLIILLVYYGLKILFRLLKPYLFKYVAKKAGQRFEQTFGHNPYDQNSHKGKSDDMEGSVSIDQMPSKNKSSKSNVGEYVDYEEID
jgi:hypothetical protein